MTAAAKMLVAAAPELAGEIVHVHRGPDDGRVEQWVAKGLAVVEVEAFEFDWQLARVFDGRFVYFGEMN